MNQIALFLMRAKGIVEREGLIFVPRRQNVEYLAERGLTVEDLKTVILNLSPSDCFDGPEPDRDPKYAEAWTVAEFSPEAWGETIYLKISTRSRPDKCKCLSVKLYRDRREEEK